MRRNLRFDLGMVVLFIGLIITGANWLHWRMMWTGTTMTPWPFLTFILVIVLSPVIFPLIWIKALWNGVVFPYVEEYRLYHPKPKLKSDERVQELEQRIIRLEERLESREDLMWLYYGTLERLLGKDKAEEEVDVQWQLWEAQIN